MGKRVQVIHAQPLHHLPHQPRLRHPRLAELVLVHLDLQVIEPLAGEAREQVLGIAAIVQMVHGTALFVELLSLLDGRRIHLLWRGHPGAALEELCHGLEVLLGIEPLARRFMIVAGQAPLLYRCIVTLRYSCGRPAMRARWSRRWRYRCHGSPRRRR